MENNNFTDNEELNKTISALATLEKLQQKVEHLEGAAQVCANAFNHKGAMGDCSEKDLENAFLSFHDQAEEIGQEIQALIEAIMKNKATLYY